MQALWLEQHYSEADLYWRRSDKKKQLLVKSFDKAFLGCDNHKARRHSDVMTM